jgi:DNA repair exonuclease SbcCD ATPase subunit
MKIVHLADIHWRGLSRHSEYKESFSDAFEKIRELSPDVIYLGGDIVHSKTQGISPELIDSLCWWFTEMSRIAPVHVILGNHDGLQHNTDRQDAISPILSALDDPNIFLYKRSGTYPTGIPGYNWCVFSCFDEEGWQNVKPIEGEINIALFHGAVWGSTTDINWEIDGDITVDFFSDFDFTLLGDIHKRQYLDNKKTIAYCGSSIQQNYGEDTGKGFLFWDIENKNSFNSKFYEIQHLNPFITICWKGSVEKTLDEADKYPNCSRFRVKSDSVIAQADSKQLQYELMRVKEATEVVFKSESTFDASKIKTASGTFNKENLRDGKTHKKLIREYYRDGKLNEKYFEKFDELIEKYMSQVTREEDTLRNTRWEINSLGFDNLFSYGNENIVNFENLPGITGIFGKNAKGKSSIIGSLMYGLFNTTDRGSIKNIHIINNRKNSARAVVDINLNGDPYRIIRSTIKHQTRKGEIYASTSLNLYKLNNLGDIEEDITEEQRRETEKILRKLIGTADDFLMTSLASQGEMSTFVKEGATSRKMILTKFLDLGVFEKMHEIAKIESYDIRNKVKSYPDIDWDEEIDNIKFYLIENDEKIELLEKDIFEKRTTLKDLNIQLATSDNPDIITVSELKAQKKIVSRYKKDIESLKDKEEEITSEVALRQKRYSKIEQVKSDFSIKDLQMKIEIQKELDRAVIDLDHQLEKNKRELDRQVGSIKKLGEVPCGDKFPTCKFIKDSHRDKKIINDQREVVQRSISSLRDAKISFESILSENVEKKIKKYNAMIKKQSDLSVQISSLIVRHNNIENEMGQLESSLSRESSILDGMSSRLVRDEENPASVIRSNIILLEDEIQRIDKKRLGLFEDVASLRVQVSDMENKRKEFEKVKIDLRTYDLFMQAVSKKGIPLQIMMSQLPLINAEISRILQGVVGFTVELEADIDTNAMDVFIDYGDSRRVIELASGMEKMMSSLAIRVALINVSSLTKTNMLIIDEGFGALDETNIAACSRLLESLKKWFRNIIIISHVDEIKDIVDNSLEIIKNEKNTKVSHP